MVNSMKTLNDINMTEHDAVIEIEYMRGWDKYLSEHLDPKEYAFLAVGYAREIVSEEMRSFGIPEDEIEEICNKVEQIDDKARLN